MAMNDVVGEMVYHVLYFLREFRGHNNVVRSSYINT